MAVRITIGKHLSHGFFRVSDAVAGRLAKDSGSPLPRLGHYLIVELPRDAFPEDSPFYETKLAELSRTQMRYSTSAPKRGWVWAVMPKR
jgi:hypothetical protein